MSEHWVATGIVGVLLIACLLGGCADFDDDVDE